MFDYWEVSKEGTVLIGIREDGEKLLVKSEDEYTSPVKNMYKVGEDYLIVTENSIYVTVSDLSTRKIS